MRWTAQPGYRVAPLSVPPVGRAGFTLLDPATTGVTFSNRLSDRAIARNRLLEIGSGVALGDVDGDGRVDVYLCGLDNRNALYRNLGGWKFREEAEERGVACPDQSSIGCVLVDLDGDGDLDLLVNGLQIGTRVFHNDGQGRFAERTDLGIGRHPGATSAALADIEGDGDLDLYVTHYRADTFFDNPRGLRMEMRAQPDGTQVLEPRDRFLTLPNADGLPRVLERGEPDRLYVNRGDGRFVPVPWEIGLFVDEDGRKLPGPPTDWGLSVLFRDLNGDRLPDLYVCNDFVAWPDRLWLNEGAHRFRAAPRHALRSVSLASMAVDAADINRDGFDDLFVADMLSPVRHRRAWQRPDVLQDSRHWPIGDPAFRPEVPRNTLHLARGDGTFAEIATFAGVAATDWTPAAAFLDVDLDGWEDLLITAGNLHDVQDADALATLRQGAGSTPEMRLANLDRLPHRFAPSVALRNRRDLTFEDASREWGFDAVGAAHGIAFGDLDQDGDLDVVVSAMNAPARLYRNESPAPRVAVRLRGAPPNTGGVGARIVVRGGAVAQSQQMIAGGRYASGDEMMRTFAAGAARELEMEVTWRSGRRSVISGARPNQIYEVDERLPTLPPAPVPQQAPPLFVDRSASLPQHPPKAGGDDLARQPLLPRTLGTLGPGVGWADLDGDGDDDLFAAEVGGTAFILFRNDGGGVLNAWTNAPAPGGEGGERSAVLAVPRSAESVDLVAGISNWREGRTHAPAFSRHRWSRSAVEVWTPPSHDMAATSIGPLAMADVDGDGDLDLFVGGRAVAGRYPLPADSRIHLAEGDHFREGQVFGGLGLISGAVFTDLDLDGDPDLALACDWGPIRVFRNEGGRFVEMTADLGLEPMRGWWNGIASGDLDGDGRPDLVVSNWGRNWRADGGATNLPPVEIGWKEVSGVPQPLLASLDPSIGVVTPWVERKRITEVFPEVAAKFPSHRAFARASAAEILGGTTVPDRRLTASSFESVALLNRGDRMEVRPLPAEAQFSPAFGVVVADLDGDGHQDVFLAQNFFGMDRELSRQDAGMGLVLLGHGTGGFRALGPLESGIAMPDEQRGCAVSDFDGDGRLDLAVGRRGGAPGVYRNARAQPGVRVAVRGSPGNPSGIGTSLRLRFGDRYGPATEIQAGSGYWSQNSSVAVLAAPLGPTAVQVRWPGGKLSEWAWPVGARGVVVTGEGLQPTP